MALEFVDDEFKFFNGPKTSLFHQSIRTKLIDKPPTYRASVSTERESSHLLRIDALFFDFFWQLYMSLKISKISY